MNSKIALLLTVLCLTGCQHFSDRDMIIRNRANDYQRTSLIEPLRIPEGLTYVNETQYPLSFDVPSGKIEQASIVPPGFGTL